MIAKTFLVVFWYLYVIVAIIHFCVVGMIMAATWGGVPEGCPRDPWWKIALFVITLSVAWPAYYGSMLLDGVLNDIKNGE